LRGVWTLAPANKRLLGVVESLKLAASANVSSYTYDEYTLGGIPISNARAYVGTLSLGAAF
jgi:hypothetical protein